jgi:hypothetical protein
MNNFKMIKISFLSVLLACLVVLYQSYVLSLFAFNCQNDRKEDIPAGSYCCGDAVSEKAGYYKFKVQTSACTTGQISFKQKVKIGENQSVDVCPSCGREIKVE